VAVVPSPFSKTSGGNQPIPPRPPSPEQTASQRRAKEFLELDKSVDSAIQRVRAQPPERMSEKEKQLVIAEIEKLAKTGKSTAELPEFNRFAKLTGVAKSVASAVIAPFSPKYNQVSDVAAKAFRGVTRVGQSAIKEGVADVRVSQGMDPFQLQDALSFLGAGQFSPAGLIQKGAEKIGVYDSKLDPKLKAALDKQGKAMKDDYKPSFKQFVSQVADSDWKYKNTATAAAVRETNPIVGFASELGVDIVADPTTYITGIGNVKYIGRAGKLALAQRLMTTEKVAQYPQLAGRTQDIIRFGQNAPIPGFKDILKAEGIETGVRVLGNIVKGSERVSKPAGLAVSATWESMMDLATKIRSTEKLSNSPASRSFMIDAGRMTKGAYRVDDATALQQVANWSARQYAKGWTPSFARKYSAEIAKTVDAARAQGLGDDLADLVERANPDNFAGKVIFDSLPTPQQDLVREYLDWQNKIYKETESVYKKFGVDFGTDVADFSFVENYIFHKLSKEAADFIAQNTGKTSRFSKFFDGGLDVADITDLSAPLRFRKYRKGSEFMGEEVKEGTIRELNEIFKRQTGTDIKFFETDIGQIAESYSYSLAKMQGRERYIRRLMDYGDVGAAKLLDKTIPDPVLRAATKTEIDKWLEVRNTVRGSLARGMNDLKQVVRRGINDAQNIVDGNLRKLGTPTTKGTNQLAREKIIRRIEELQDNIVKLRDKAETVGVDRRGEFDTINSGLLQNLQNLKLSLQNGTEELDEILLGLKTTYQAMYPNKTNIPDDIDILADRIMAVKGIPSSREGRAINTQINALRAQLSDLSPSSEEATELGAEIARLKDLDNGFRVASEYRAAQDYAPDNGFLFISGREMAETDEMQIGVKLLRTSANGLPDPNDVMAVRVFGNDELIDTRTTGGVARTFGVFDFGDGLLDQMDLAGIDAAPLRDGLDAVRVGLPIDPELEQAFPEVADLIKLLEGNTAREILPYGDPQLIKAIYEEIVDATVGILVKVGVDNADLVARSMVDGSIGWVADIGVETNSARGILLPAQLFDDSAELDDIVVALAPRVSLRATDSVTGPVQDSTSPLVQAIMRTDSESAANAARAKLNELRAREAEINDTGAAIRQELIRLARSKGGYKATATKRKNAAALAKERAGKVRNTPREIIIDGKPVTLTPAQIERRFEKLTATEQRLRNNMERTLAAEQTNLREGGLTLSGSQAKLAANTDRLRVLFDEALALHAWDTGTGMMIRDDIAAGIDLIASMPPEGVAGDATRAWLASVQRGVEASSLIKNESIKTAYQRLHDLVKYDEWNLSLADEALTTAQTKLEDLDAGKFGAILDTVKNRVLEGWEPIEGLGVQVPKEVLDVWKPNLEKLLAKQNRGRIMKSMDYINKVFKTYAIGTPGFVVRNLYSALFTNGIAGVDAQTMLDGYRAANYYNKFGPARWLDEMGVTNPTLRDEYEKAILAVEASGRRGDFSDLVEPVVGGTRREKIANGVLNNYWTKSLRNVNSRVEDAVRLPLALKSIRNGDDYVTAAQQVTRYHFDYTDLSNFDESALRFIPFWIWTTRNIPNQLANQWMRPQVYSLYESLQESLPVDDSVLMPSWMKDYEPLGFSRFGASPNMILRPDLPHQRLERTIRDLTSERIIGQMYPVPKLIAEKIARRNTALDIPFKDDAREAKGIDKPIAELINMLGNPLNLAPMERTETGANEVGTTDFLQYATGNILPFIAQLQGLAGGKLGGKTSYEDRQASKIATFLGIPVDFVTDKIQGSEAIGRQFNIAEYIKELNRVGYVENKDVTNKRVSDLKKANEAASDKVKNDRINQLLLERLRIKDRYGEKSPEYKALTKQINDARNPTSRQKQLDENYIILRYGKDSPEHKLFIAKQKRKKP
jgi:hypothetical protein